MEYDRGMVTPTDCDDSVYEINRMLQVFGSEVLKLINF